MIKIVLGLIAVMAANVLAGSTLASLKDEWNTGKFFSGLYKALTIIVSTGLIYLCGYLNPDILAISVGGTDLNLIEALRILFISGIVTYGVMDIKKIADIIKIKVAITESKTDDEKGLG